MSGDLGYWLGVVVAFLTFIASSPADRVDTKCVTDVETCNPPLTAPPPSVSGRCAEWADLAFAVGWPRDQWPTISRVMACESNCQPSAHNRSGASGLMQLMPMWWRGVGDPYDPGFNLARALDVWHAQGWRAWSCY